MRSTGKKEINCSLRTRYLVRSCTIADGYYYKGIIAATRSALYEYVHVAILHVAIALYEYIAIPVSSLPVVIVLYIGVAIIPVGDVVRTGLFLLGIGSV